MFLFAKQTVILGALAAATLCFAAPQAASAQDNDQSVCTAASPGVGAVIRGPVLMVEDGSTLCVALAATPDTWVRLTLADAPIENPIRKASLSDTNDSPRGTLMAVAFSQTISCTVQADSRALCALDDGRSVGKLLRQPTALAAGRDWR